MRGFGWDLHTYLPAYGLEFRDFSPFGIFLGCELDGSLVGRRYVILSLCGMRLIREKLFIIHAPTWHAVLA